MGLFYTQLALGKNRVSARPNRVSVRRHDANTRSSPSGKIMNGNGRSHNKNIPDPPDPSHVAFAEPRCMYVAPPYISPASHRTCRITAISNAVDVGCS